MTTALHREVITRAYGTCQCRADSPTGCGRPHKSTDGACLVRHTEAAPLHAVPRRDVRPEVAAALPVEDFMALCDRCHAALSASRRKGRADSTQAPAPMDALF